jgi:hypothetical protein
MADCFLKSGEGACSRFHALMLMEDGHHPDWYVIAAAGRKIGAAPVAVSGTLLPTMRVTGTSIGDAP